MEYTINKELLGEIALHVGGKKFTFKEVFDAIDKWATGNWTYDNGTKQPFKIKWTEFLSNGKPKTLIDCVTEVYTITNDSELTIMIEELGVDRIIEDISPDDLSYTNKASGKTFIN